MICLHCLGRRPFFTWPTNLMCLLSCACFHIKVCMTSLVLNAWQGSKRCNPTDKKELKPYPDTVPIQYAAHNKYVITPIISVHRNVCLDVCMRVQEPVRVWAWAWACATFSMKVYVFRSGICVCLSVFQPACLLDILASSCLIVPTCPPACPCMCCLY